MIKVNDLSVAFGKQPVFQNLNVTINQGEFLAVVGMNGAGKTTLIRTILGQLKPKHGTIITDSDLKIGYVPQFRNIDSDYPLSVSDFIGLNFTGLKWPWMSKTEKQRIQEVIAEVGLSKIANRPLGKASGGEKQKTYLAQALVDRPNLLILDESTASLDPNTKEELLKVVKKINQEQHLTVIFVSHDMELVTQYPDHYLWLQPDASTSGPINELAAQMKEGIVNV